MNPRPTVWVLKEQMKQGANGSSPMDYSPAYEFGDVCFITDFDLPTHPDSSIAKEWRKKISDFIRIFDPDRDFVILTGSPLAIFTLGRLLDACPKVQILVWRREQNRYILTTVQ